MRWWCGLVALAVTACASESGEDLRPADLDFGETEIDPEVMPIDPIDPGTTDDKEPLDPTSCASAQLEAALAQMGSWDSVSCGHAWLATRSDARSHNLILNLFTTQRDFAAGDTLSHDFGAPAGQVASLQVAVGTNVPSTCQQDLDTGSDAVISRRWAAVEGAAVLTVDALEQEAGDAKPFRGTVALTGIVLEAIDATGDRCPLPDMQWPDMPFGTLPGN